MEVDFRKLVQTIEELGHYNMQYQRRIIEQNDEIIRLQNQIAQMQQLMAQTMGVNVNVNTQNPFEEAFNTGKIKGSSSNVLD
jgi:predicted RNase H-like nuclease (RuvC/YqgF family)